ncbi:hypothetical protein ThidrDRAFT_0777 [Thiorhodococcus drewsii AZ1]|uniref:Uncharacterized protein n=1 Tax=Thiorhodococcus drewsii AZ1 TaxID=765913 RepID=G2DXQ0_9GAMM|nr:hypothetical protein ThidrDRAFT_0777 [Thiorhodococcus drewsii AZ1]
MEKTKEMLFMLQRFQILALFTNSATEKNVTPSYAFAWFDSVYPFLSESAPWHKPYADCFKVQEPELEELHSFLCDKWDANQPISFYDLESHYGIHGSSSPGPVWSRHSLRSACRYIYLLENNFDNAFWTALCKNGHCPMEAHSITSEFGPKNIYFE